MMPNIGTAIGFCGTILIVLAVYRYSSPPALKRVKGEDPTERFDALRDQLSDNQIGAAVEEVYKLKGGNKSWDPKEGYLSYFVHDQFWQCLLAKNDRGSIKCPYSVAIIDLLVEQLKRRSDEKIEVIKRIFMAEISFVTKGLLTTEKHHRCCFFPHEVQFLASPQKTTGIGFKKYHELVRSDQGGNGKFLGHILAKKLTTNLTWPKTLEFLKEFESHEISNKDVNERFADVWIKQMKVQKDVVEQPKQDAHQKCSCFQTLKEQPAPVRKTVTMVEYAPQDTEVTETITKDYTKWFNRFVDVICEDAVSHEFVGAMVKSVIDVCNQRKVPADDERRQFLTIVFLSGCVFGKTGDLTVKVRKFRTGTELKKLTDQTGKLMSPLLSLCNRPEMPTTKIFQDNPEHAKSVPKYPMTKENWIRNQEKLRELLDNLSA